MLRRTLQAISLFLLILSALLAPVPAQAHRSGCHRWHSCPSDTGSYVCGDLGYDTYCPNKKPPTPQPAVQPPPPPAADVQPVVAPPAPVQLASGRPVVDWHTYDIEGSLQTYWRSNNGLPVFGLAKTPP